MLFTGFFDKNGRQVFQGDVVKALRAQRRGRAIVGYEEMFFEILLDPETQSFRFGSNQLGWSALADVAAIYEIVGNRFENPELLSRINSAADDTLQVA